MSLQIEFKTNYRFINPAFEKAVREAIKQFLEKAVAKAQSKAPKRTGNLAASITYLLSEKAAEIRVGAPYAAYVEYGTKPHLILPKTAQALRFEVGGEVVYAKRVHHPGTQPQPFLRPAVAEALVEFHELFKRILEGELR